ncbi:MAG: Asp-tRNA(Asn)/Glu-tRNA(Gln) amidotransferase subunit GatA [Betaproteobacteria bacterium]|nr:Asp-tRNA(Asn)/Glu-tRNA(Gln) amidotransferase subunit GatA [Betaproteobacteria bacterium]
MAGLQYLSIDAAAALIRNGELSPVELTRAHLHRIEALDQQLHAFITVTREIAVEAAYQAEEEIRTGHYRGPLHGIPIAHKDIIWTKGIRTTAHSRFLKDWVPLENATVFERLRDVGAICLGKTSLHEFAFGSPGPDEAFPAARNPWNPDYAPGSSSSGSGAAVAAGLCMGATGTDTGGSIRHPASVCGIVGIKPTFGRVSAYGVIPLAASLDHVGPMTRTVRDNAIMLQVMAGYDARDPYSVDHPVPDFQRLIGRSIRGVCIGVPRRFIEATPHEPEMLDAFANAEKALRELGAATCDIEVPGLELASDVTGLIMAYEAYQYHNANFEAHPDQFGATFKQRVLKAAQYGNTDYQHALEKGRQLRAAYASVFASGIDVIISPGREGPADSMARLLADPTKRGVTNRMYNLTGMPALTLPMGFSSQGLPLGLQIAGRHFSEEMIYQVAAAYEAAAGWCERHPSL